MKELPQRSKGTVVAAIAFDGLAGRVVATAKAMAANNAIGSAVRRFSLIVSSACREDRALRAANRN